MKYHYRQRWIKNSLADCFLKILAFNTLVINMSELQLFGTIDVLAVSR